MSLARTPLGTLLAVALAGVLLAGCSAPAPRAPGTSPVPAPTAQRTTGPAPTTASPSPTPSLPACTAEAAALPLAERVGQLVMVGVEVGLPASQREVIRDHHLGSAIVMGPTPGGVDGVARLTAALRELGGETGMLVAADQEGGLVQRLQGEGFGTIPSAARQARWSDAELRRRAATWGRALALAGVLLDLAPVADVVPRANRSANEPIAKLGRGYGSDPDVVSAKVAAFSAGMRAAGVAVAVKHFPGLGAVRGNTDFAARVVDRTTTADSRLLVPFRAAVRDGAAAVMVSSAYYARIDRARPAMHSPTVVGLLREWGFAGVVVSDDLGAAAALQAMPAGRRAVRFVAAGGDLVLTVDARTAGPMASALLQRAQDDERFAARVTASAVRVRALKASLGAYRCG